MIKIVLYSLQVCVLAGISYRRYRQGNRGRAALYAVLAAVSIVVVLMAIHLWKMEKHLAEMRAELNEYGVIHKPKSGCPPGFKEVPDMFELKGRKSPACVNPQNPNGMIDYLLPGERMHFEIEIPLPPAKPGPAA